MLICSVRLLDAQLSEACNPAEFWQVPKAKLPGCISQAKCLTNYKPGGSTSSLHLKQNNLDRRPCTSSQPIEHPAWLW